MTTKRETETLEEQLAQFQGSRSQVATEKANIMRERLVMVA